MAIQPSIESTAFRVSCKCGFPLKAFRIGSEGHHLAGFVALRDGGKVKAGNRVDQCPGCEQQLGKMSWAELVDRLPAAFGA